MSAKEWLLLPLPVYGDRALQPLTLQELAPAVKKQLLRPHYPVGRAGVGVDRADAFEELQILFEHYKVPKARPSEEIDFPAPMVDLLRERTLALVTETMDDAAASSAFDAPTEVDTDETAVHGDDDALGESLFSENVPGPVIEDSPPPSAPRHAEAGEDDPLKEIMLIREWHLPERAEFKGRHKYPQSLANLKKLIEKGTLKTYHRIKQGNEEVQYEGYAGTFPELVPMFTELDPHFDPANVDNLAQEIEDERAQAPSEQQALETDPVLRQQQKRDRKAEGMTGFSREQNQFTKASQIGLSTGLIFYVFAFLISLAGFQALPGQGYFDLWQSNLMLSIRSLGQSLLVAHVIGFINGVNRDNNWTFGMIYVISFVVTTIQQFFSFMIMPDMSQLFAPLGGMGGGIMTAAYFFAALFVLVVTLISSAFYAFVMVNIANWINQSSIGSDYYYEYPNESKARWEAHLAVGIVVAMFISSGVEFMMLRNEIHRLQNSAGVSDSVVVEDIFGRMSMEDTDSYVVTGLVRNESGSPVDIWTVTITLYDDNGDAMAKGTLRNGVFTQLQKQPSPFSDEPIFSPFSEFEGTQLEQEERQETMRTEGLDGDEEREFRVEFTNLDTVPSDVKARPSTGLLGEFPGF